MVPGNQMYLPMLGIDLREHFKQIRSVAPGKFSPSTQAVVLHALLHGPINNYTPSRLAKELGYTVMTLTRAFDELASLWLAEVVTEGRERVLRFSDGKKVLWEKITGVHAQPGKEDVHLYVLLNRSWAGVPAGLTALAHFTLLAPPSVPVYAVGLDDWKSMKLT